MAKVRELSALEIGFVVKEMQVLVGARLQKIYQPEKKEFLFDFHVPGQGKRLLKIVFPTLIFLTEEKPGQAEPPMFCQRLRKQIMGLVVEKVHQHGFERIVVIEFNGLTLILELFGTGNIILAKDQVIELVHESRLWKGRTVKPGAVYAFPPSVNLYELGFEGFTALLKERSFDSAVKLFAIALSLGGRFAEELCARARVDKNARELTAEEEVRAYASLMDLLSTLPSPLLAEDGEIAPFPLMTFKGKKIVEVPTFSQAVEKLALQRQHRPSAEDKERGRLKAIINQQEAHREELEEEILSNTRKGELIYEHYTLVKGVLSEMKRIAKEYDAAEIKGRLRGHRYLKGYDPKAKTISLDL